MVYQVVVDEPAEAGTHRVVVDDTLGQQPAHGLEARYVGVGAREQQP